MMLGLAMDNVSRRAPADVATMSSPRNKDEAKATVYPTDQFEAASLQADKDPGTTGAENGGLQESHRALAYC